MTASVKVTYLGPKIYKVNVFAEDKDPEGVWVRVPGPDRILEIEKDGDTPSLGDNFELNVWKGRRIVIEEVPG